MRDVPVFTCQHYQVQDADVVSVSFGYKSGDRVNGKWHPACFKAVKPTLKRKGDGITGILQYAAERPAKPRPAQLPLHKLAYELGRAMADHEFDRLYGSHKRGK